MNYYKQVLTVTLWEYRRFFKLKNEVLGIAVMLIIFTISFFGGKYAASGSSDKILLTVPNDFDPLLSGMLSEMFTLQIILPEKLQTC